MSVKILAFDLDYTLLNDKKVIPPENFEALEYAAAKGVYIVPATGRVYQGIPEELRSLPFMRWFITANGAYIYDAVADRAAARAEIPLEQTLDFFTYCDGLDCLYDCYQDNWGYMAADMLKIAPDIIPDAAVKKMIQTLRTPVPELKEYLRQKGTDERERTCRSSSSILPTWPCAQSSWTNCRGASRSLRSPPPCPSILRSTPPRPPRAAPC